MIDGICYICGNKLPEKYFETDTGPDGYKSNEPVRVCSQKCSKEYEQILPYKGKPIQHWSRITGYYQNVEGWNEAKKKELKDRKRYNM